MDVIARKISRGSPETESFVRSCEAFPLRRLHPRTEWRSLVPGDPLVFALMARSGKIGDGLIMGELVLLRYAGTAQKHPGEHGANENEVSRQLSLSNRRMPESLGLRQVLQGTVTRCGARTVSLYGLLA